MLGHQEISRWTGIVVACLVALAWMGPAQADFATRMASAHQHDAPVASKAAEMAPAQAVSGREVQYATVDGQSVTGYLAVPEQADGELPGVILIHEWWGLNDNIRAMADRLAGEGYRALAVDLYGGEAASGPDQAKALMSDAMAHEARLRDNLRQAYDYLMAQGSQDVGVIGWCFGGGWSLQTALLLPEKIDATVIYYGRPVTDADTLAALQMPVLGFYGGQDQSIPVAQVNAFEQALGASNRNAQIRIYPDAGHAFANPSGARYVPAAAADAWARTLRFLEQHLSAGTE